MNLEGKTAIVTGASRGVGRETARMLAQAGCSVAINYSSSQDQAESLAHELTELGAKAICVQGDMGQQADCDNLIRTAIQELGNPSVLVNNAGTTEFIPHEELDRVTAEVWERLFAVNVIGPFNCMRAVLESMRNAGGGEIVNVASIAGQTTAGSCIPYGASKAALINLTVNMARVAAPKVRVNAIAPGFIAGDWLVRGLGDAFENAKAMAEASSVLGRVCEPSDVAAAILSVITGSDLVTGQTLVVDGGYTISSKRP